MSSIKETENRVKCHSPQQDPEISHDPTDTHCWELLLSFQNMPDIASGLAKQNAHTCTDMSHGFCVLIFLVTSNPPHWSHSSVVPGSSRNRPYKTHGLTLDATVPHSTITKQIWDEAWYISVRGNLLRTLNIGTHFLQYHPYHQATLNRAGDPRILQLEKMALHHRYIPIHTSIPTWCSLPRKLAKVQESRSIFSAVCTKLIGHMASGYFQEWSMSVMICAYSSRTCGTNHSLPTRSILPVSGSRVRVIPQSRFT